jgi:hypothetical protein
VRWGEARLLVPSPPPPSWAVSHAMVPVAEPLADGTLRIWFSSKDAEGRSQIGWTRLALEAPEAAEFSAEPLLVPGPPGTFDDSGAMTGCVVEEDGRRFLYYIGWSRSVAVPFATFIGLAVSEDGGETFERASPAPVLGRGRHDPYLTTSPWVLVEDGRWRMWYATGTGWPPGPGGRPRHRYRIAYAESRDGVEWERDGHVCIDYAGPEEYAIARPCVVRDGDRYRMWFCARGEAYRLGYAESADGYDWERDDGAAGLEPSGAGWDSEMQAYPFVLDHGGRRHLLYNGNGYGATGILHAVETS